MRKFITAALLGVTFAGAAAVAVPAFADPSPVGTFRPLAGVGSDTIDPVMDAMSNVITIGGVKQIANYNALPQPSANIQTQSDPACSIPRPNGSGQGIAALDAALVANKNCLQFARSSSGVTATSTPNQLTWVPFAIDGVAYAVRQDGSVPKSLTTAQLQSIFKCATGFQGILPQLGSGTRKFWLAKMGITEDQIFGTNGVAQLYPCLTGAGTAASPLYTEEHDGRTLDVTQVMPFSAAQYNAQSTGTIADIRGKTILGNIDGAPASVLNQNNGVYNRPVFNVIPTGNISTPPWSTVFVGPSSLVCAQSALINKFGFATSPTCGDSSQHN